MNSFTTIAEEALAKNPSRLMYFERGLRPASDTSYLIVADSAENALRNALGRWDRSGFDDQYVRDLVTLAKAYLGDPDDRARALSIRCLNRSPPNLDVARLTLVSRAYWMLSERDPQKRKIYHGRLVNWASTPLALTLVASLVAEGASEALILSLLAITVGPGIGPAPARCRTWITARLIGHIHN